MQRLLHFASRNPLHPLSFFAADMSDAEPTVAIAVAVPQGSVGGVVQGTAVGVPVTTRQHSSSLLDAEAEPSTAPVAVAEAYVYSPFMAKVFTGLDADKSGNLDIAEIEAALTKLGLTDTDAQTALAGFDKNGDGKVDLAEWEAGLSSEMRSAIEAKADNDGGL